MNELFYFAFADLMVRIAYDKETNALRYASHRKIAGDERAIVEQYILASIAIKTDYFKRTPSRFIYLGLEAQLVKYRERFHRQTMLEKEKDMEASVAGLINQSMQHFYFEQIGDTILDARANIGAGLADERHRRHKAKLTELVKAYNTYADQKVTMDKIIPAELKSYFDIATERKYFQSDYSVHANGASDWIEERP